MYNNNILVPLSCFVISRCPFKRDFIFSSHDIGYGGSYTFWGNEYGLCCWLWTIDDVCDWNESGCWLSEMFGIGVVGVEENGDDAGKYEGIAELWLIEYCISDVGKGDDIKDWNDTGWLVEMQGIDGVGVEESGDNTGKILGGIGITILVFVFRNRLIGSSSKSVLSTR